MTRGETTGSTEAVRAIKFGNVMVTLVVALACGAGAPSDETHGSKEYCKFHLPA